MAEAHGNGKGGKEEIMTAIITEKEKAQEEPLAVYAPKKPAMQYEDLPLSTAERYKPFSKYPYIVRDVAFWVPLGTDSLEVLNLIHATAGELLVKSPTVFDRFEKGEKLSLAVRLIFQSFEKTLTDEEVNPIMEKVYEKLKEQGFEIR